MWLTGFTEECGGIYELNPVTGFVRTALEAEPSEGSRSMVRSRRARRRCGTGLLLSSAVLPVEGWITAIAR